MRRERNYIGKVEANLRQIERTASQLTSGDADVTNIDMWGVLVAARQALRALGHDYPHPVEPWASDAEA